MRVPCRRACLADLCVPSPKSSLRTSRCHSWWVFQSVARQWSECCLSVLGSEAMYDKPQIPRRESFKPKDMRVYTFWVVMVRTPLALSHMLDRSLMEQPDGWSEFLCKPRWWPMRTGLSSFRQMLDPKGQCHPSLCWWRPLRREGLTFLEWHPGFLGGSHFLSREGCYLFT